jgi:uncharacterized protein YdaU (DUF1376 family)
VNFYPHHIGDYLTATAHLSWLEDAAYRRLMDVYYSRESAIPLDVVQACRLVRAASKEERRAVDTVLREFFTETPEGWKHRRCDAEIVKATEAAERARLNGKKGGRPPASKPTTNPEETQPVISGNPEKSKSQAPNPNPITNTSNTPKPPPAPPDGFAEFWQAYPKKAAKPAAEKAFRAAKLNGHLPEVIADVMAKASSDDWLKDGGKFIPNPATYLNQRRWEDEQPEVANQFAGAL